MAGLLSNLQSFAQGASNSAAETAGLPVDAIAWALRKLGVPIPEAPMGGTDWMKQKGLMREPENKTAGLLGDMTGTMAQIVVPMKSAQIAGGLLGMADNLAKPGPGPMGGQRGAITWHGSPHKFDKFDASKIGTGEGAQAYGHGLYLAEAPEVAGSYMKNLSKDTFTSPNGSVINRAKLVDMGFDGGDVNVMLGAIQRHSGDFKAAAESMASHRPTAARFLRAIGDQGAINTGSLYKVDLPDEHIAKMLDWDKPLSQQGALKSNSVMQGFLPDETGAEIYRVLSKELAGGSQFVSGKNDAAAEALRQAGIPGIRYLDGGSRGAGAGTSNYVVFPGNEGLLTILERNGIPLR